MRITTAIALAALTPYSASADVQPFPPGFRTEMIATNGTQLNVRVGGQGSAVVLLHGYGDTGDMWAPLAAALMATHTVVIPDLRGMGLSDHPPGGYDKKTEGQDIQGVLKALGIDHTDVVAHDIGTMVAYAFVAQHRDEVGKVVLMEAPIPGVGPWDDFLKMPILWHFHFGGPDMERLVAGRERIYLDRFWNDFAADPAKIDETTRNHYAALYALPGGMHSGFAQFLAFDQDAVDNKAFLAQGPLTMPVLAVGADHSLGPLMETVARAAASNVTGLVISGSGHWLMEEQPSATIAAITEFLK